MNHLETSDSLDLTFLATGYYQHVFTHTCRPDDAWVYKVPAAFGQILPFRHTFRVFRPRGPGEALLHLGCIRLPHAFHARVYRSLADRSERVGVASFERPVALLRRFSEGITNSGEHLASAYCRRYRRQAFERMLGLIERVSQRGLAELLLPCAIVRHGKARLRVDGKSLSYRGPILIQQRATLIKRAEDLDRFAWQELINAQHRFWRRGIAFSAHREILGPQSWAVTDGHPRLADTSALTDDYHTARRCLSGPEMDRGEARAMRGLTSDGPSVRAKEYFRFIRREINRAAFERLWKRDINPSRTDRPSFPSRIATDSRQSDCGPRNR